MISNKNFDKERINKIAKTQNVSNEHLEKLACAFKVLETLVENEIDFIFKGGTSILLLLNKLNRLSIDIDVLCPKSKKEEIINKIKNIKSDFFSEINEQIRPPKPGVDKAHFQFNYESIIDEEVEESFVLLDIVFEDNIYSVVQIKNIENELFVFEEPFYKVNLPTVDELIGDKLVAFAPHTSGIKFTDYYKDERPKHIEIIKQLYDVSTLLDYSTDFELISKTYRKLITNSIPYYKNVNKVEDCLEDTILTCSNIIDYGEFGPKDEYKILMQGLNGFNAYVLGGSVSSEALIKMATKVYVLATKILFNNDIGSVEILDSTCFFGKYKQKIQLALQDKELYSELRKCAYMNAKKNPKFGSF